MYPGIPVGSTPLVVPVTIPVLFTLTPYIFDRLLDFLVEANLKNPSNSSRFQVGAGLLPDKMLELDGCSLIPVENQLPVGKS